MFIPVSIEEFIKNYKKNNPKENAAGLREALVRAADAKKNGTVCHMCGQPIWAIGSATAGWNGCFSCITGETDDSTDYEIDSVCV